MRSYARINHLLSAVKRIVVDCLVIIIDNNERWGTLFLRMNRTGGSAVREKRGQKRYLILKCFAVWRLYFIASKVICNIRYGNGIIYALNVKAFFLIFFPLNEQVIET